MHNFIPLLADFFHESDGQTPIGIGGGICVIVFLICPIVGAFIYGYWRAGKK
jgi:hypothetical protein